jgi:transcriptional regulator of acetoin/glycerol metabolism
VSDIRRLVRFFLERAAAELNKPSLVVSPGVVEPDDLPITITGPARPVLFRDIERRAISEALAENGGNRTRTAKQLGISLRTLQYRLKDYNLNLEEVS